MSMLQFLLFILGLGLLVGGAEALVRGASRLAQRLGISPLIIGLTIVAMGTSTPEVAVSLQAALIGEADISLGNVVGSNICNVLLILGVSALAAPLIVAPELIRRDVPLMIGVSLATLAFAWDQKIDRREGLLFVAGLAGYIYSLYLHSRRNPHAPLTEDELRIRGGTWITELVLVVVGLAMLVQGSRFLVDAAISMAEALGVSKLVVGLTVVAVGTSLPELATSFVATLRGERDIAVGNVVGSNIFNILCVLGASSAIAPDGINVAESALRFDIPVMLIVAIACIPIFLSGAVIERWEGGLFLLYFIAYTTYLVLDSTGSPRLPLFNQVMLFLFVPVSVAAVLILFLRSLRIDASPTGEPGA